MALSTRNGKHADSSLTAVLTATSAHWVRAENASGSAGRAIRDSSKEAVEGLLWNETVLLTIDQVEDVHARRTKDQQRSDPH